MKHKIRLIALILLFLAKSSLFSQVTFTQTATTDFNKGMANNVLIADNSVSLPLKVGTINDWVATTNLPQSLMGQATVTWRSFVYLIGGYDGTTYSNLVYNANLEGAGISAWETQNALPTPLRDMAVVAGPTKLFVFGGRTNGVPSNAIYSATLNDDGTIGQWEVSSITLPQALWGHQALYINGYIYITGGTTQSGTNTAVNSVYFSKVNADGNISAFSTTTNLPESRNGHSMVNYNNAIYILGGYDNAGVKKATVYYAPVNADGSCGTWLNATLLPNEISNHISTCSNGIITVIGGEDNAAVSNKFYYADIDNAPSLSWTLSDKFLYDKSKYASTFVSDGKIFFAGGKKSSGNAMNSIRYATLTPGTNKVKKGIFVSDPFVIGNPKNIEKLTYSISYTSGSDGYELLYRMADTDKVFGNWISSGVANPALIGMSKSYIQYMFRLNANAANNVILNELTLTISGYTQLCGELNTTPTLTLAGSPYWATCDISFTTGTHNIEPGVTILFSPNTGLTIDQASLNFNGTSGSPITLSYYGEASGLWNGVYFADASDNGVTSTMNYTTIEKAGNGINNANLYLVNTNQPTISNCTFRLSDGLGIRLQTSTPVITSATIQNNTEHGLYLKASNPVLISLNSSYNGISGIYYGSANLNPTYSNCLSSNNLYGLYSVSPDNSFAPATPISLQLSSNATDIAVEGGTISADRTWKYFPNGYALLGHLTIAGGVDSKLTIAPGTKIKVKKDKGIFIGGDATTGGTLYAHGKADSTIVFTALNNTIGGWSGLYFDDGSDYDSYSSLRYCTIEKGNEYNIFSINSNEPHLMYCKVQNSVTYGIKQQNSNINIVESTIKKSAYGLYLDNSDPTLDLVEFDSISNTCVYLANGTENPTYITCQMKNSVYGIGYPNPDFDILTFNNITFQNLKGSVVFQGGDIYTNRTWNYNSAPYVILGDVRIINYGDKNRLTLKPGITLKFKKNTGLQIGLYDGWNSYGGELFAIGTPDSTITFTAINDSVGGWNGMYFSNYSDEYASISSLKYCTIEKGNQYNIYCENTVQPNIQNCAINKSADKGIFAENALLKIKNTQFLNNGGYGLYYNNAYYVDTLFNLQFSGNNLDGVAIEGGDISEDRTWNNFGDSPYIALGDIRIINYGDKSRLTLKPGITLKFKKNTGLQIGLYDGWNSYGGELFAIGTPDSKITFTPLNDSVGGWNGMYFSNYSDEYASISSLKYCTIEKGNQYNIWCENTIQPNIQNCAINNSADKGIFAENALLKIKNTQFLNNGGYGLYYNNAYYVDTLFNLQFSGNNLDCVAIEGGDISEDRTWNNFGDSPYVVLGDIRIINFGDKSRLTLKPGITLKFKKNTGLQIGLYDGWNSYGGELFAIGTPDSKITFTPLNDSVGGWNGMYFSNYSDEYGSISSLKYCTIEKGNDYNIWCENTSQPTIDRCIIHKSADKGIWIDASTNEIKKTRIVNNTGNGIHLTGNSNPVIGNNYVTTCDIFNNGGYNVFNNTENTINMRYNYWGGCDSSYLAAKVYDKSDLSSLGSISVNPLSWLPANQIEPVQLSGKLYYDNNISKPIKNAEISIKDYQNTTLAAATTSNNGSYNFDPIQIGVANKIEFAMADAYGGVNSADALKVLRHFVHLETLSPNYAQVADVNLSHTINGTDAMLIAQRFVGLITSFASGDLQIDCDLVSITEPNFTYQFSALWYGDVNGSYGPMAKSPTIWLVYDSVVSPASGQEFDMPIYINNNLTIGAISLSLNYPDEYLDIQDVKLASTGESLVFTAQEGVLRVGWYNLNPIITNQSDMLIVLKLKAKDLSNQVATIRFELNDNSEISDSNAVTINGVEISMPVIPSLLTGIIGNTTSENLLNAVYPNPARGNTTIDYTLPFAAHVKISIFDMLGREISALVNSHRSKGNHKVGFDASQLTPGIYVLKIFIDGERHIQAESKILIGN